MFPMMMEDGGNGMRVIVQWIVLLGFFMFVMPKLYFYQIFAKLEASARKLEEISKDGQRIVLKKTKKFGKDRKSAKQLLDRFIDFFMIPPVSLDPYGIMRKLEHLVDNTEKRFRDTAREIAPKADSEEVMNVFMGLQASVMIHTIAKIIRHYVEMVKKFKNLQIAMIIQMQLPIIEKMVEAELKGLKSFLKGHPIGDAVGPLVIASMLGREGKEIAPDVIAHTDERWGRKITFMKAVGPGGRLGKLGEAVRKSCKGKKIAKIMTIDAAQKLEGEKTGSVSEGVGVAIGGAGIQKEKIERIATELDIPMEAIAIKMSPFEAISPMPKEVSDAVKTAKDFLKERVEDMKKGSHIIVVGVGNTCGIPNTNKGLKKIIKKIEKEAKRIKEEEEKKKGIIKTKKKKENENNDDDEKGGTATNLNMFMQMMQGLMSSKSAGSESLFSRRFSQYPNRSTICPEKRLDFAGRRNY